MKNFMIVVIALVLSLALGPLSLLLGLAFPRAFQFSGTSPAPGSRRPAPPAAWRLDGPFPAGRQSVAGNSLAHIISEHILL